MSKSACLAWKYNWRTVLFNNVRKNSLTVTRQFNKSTKALLHKVVHLSTVPKPFEHKARLAFSSWHCFESNKYNVVKNLFNNRTCY